MPTTVTCRAPALLALAGALLLPATRAQSAAGTIEGRIFNATTTAGVPVDV